MYRVRQQDLPFQGSSHQFVGADQGDVNISVFLLRALPGRGPGPHRHPYDEVQFLEGGQGPLRGEWRGVRGERRRHPGDQGRRGPQLQCIGDEPLVQVDVHLSPRFIQENLDTSPKKTSPPMGFPLPAVPLPHNSLTLIPRFLRTSISSSLGAAGSPAGERYKRDRTRLEPAPRVVQRGDLEPLRLEQLKRSSAILAVACSWKIPTLR